MPYVVYFICFVLCIGLYFFKSEASRRFWAQRGAAVALMIVLDGSFILSGYAPSRLVMLIIVGAVALLLVMGFHARSIPEDWSFFQDEGHRSTPYRHR